LEDRGGDLEAHGQVDILHNMTEGDAKRLRTLIERHVQYTGSPRGQAILADWERYRGQFVKVMPTEYRRALQNLQTRSLVSVGA
jgi:glutamate synthase (NADPH/NADH) large chain